MKRSASIGALAAIFAAFNAWASQGHEVSQPIVFRNGYGDEISLASDGAIISGRLYPAADCSTAKVSCIKYGSSFAITAPIDCPKVYPYKWYAARVQSIFLAPTPHDIYRALMSTSYGGLVAFTYGGKAGIVELYYAPAVLIGTKAGWRDLGRFDSDRIEYVKVSKGALLPCKG